LALYPPAREEGRESQLGKHHELRAALIVPIGKPVAARVDYGMILSQMSASVSVTKRWSSRPQRPRAQLLARQPRTTNYDTRPDACALRTNVISGGELIGRKEAKDIDS